MNTLETEAILTVSQLTRSIKNILENEYRFVRISGEISNFKMPYSGHCYFTLKDDSAQIRAVLFKQQKRFVNVALQDGQDVVCFGRITVYEPRGEYQIIVDSVELFGTGMLQKAFEQLRSQKNTSVLSQQNRGHLLTNRSRYSGFSKDRQNKELTDSNTDSSRKGSRKGSRR
jgi:exodeoxyribonuclease VII large subunit